MCIPKEVNHILTDRLSSLLLCTIHKIENTNDSIRHGFIVPALNEMTKDKQRVLPLHPRTKKTFHQEEYGVSNITVIASVGYLI